MLIAQQLRVSDQEGEDRNQEPCSVTTQPPTAGDAETVNAHSGGVDTAEEITGLRRSIRFRMLSLHRRSLGIIAAGAIAVAFAAAYPWLRRSAGTSQHN